MINWNMWLRWSWRDLRERWLQVIAIALIIALGTGVFSGLGGQKTWRIDSYDKSYGRLHMHDLHIDLTEGSFVNGENLLNVLRAEDGDWSDGVDTVEARLIMPTLVDASNNGDNILVPGRIVGVDVSDGGPNVDSIFVPDGQGRPLTEGDILREDEFGTRKLPVILEYKFARHYKLEPGDPVSISGDVALDFIGSGHSPEYFAVIPEGSVFGDESDYAVLFMPVENAQRLTGHKGQVNNLVVLLEEGADLDAVSKEIEARIKTAQEADDLPKFDVTITKKEDDYVREMMYTDAEGDQVTWNLIAMLFLIGAAFGAFNLAGRIVEAQRRQIGIGMALGLPRRWIAFRPLLVGAQIAILGTIFGLIAGLILSKVFSGVFETIMPMPYWDPSFYWQGFVGGALLGILLPFLATLFPVWRAVRVQPVDAIQSGYLVAKGGGLSWITNYVPLPGKSFIQMPVKNILRSPWRSLLTILGVAIAIVLMTMFVGFLDTFIATIEKGEDSWLYRGEDRVVVGLDFFYPVLPDDEQSVYPDIVAAHLPDPIPALSELKTEDGQPLFAGSPVTSLFIGGKLLAEKEEDEIEIVIELDDMNNPIWIPRLLEGELVSDEPGIIIAQKAAEDLGVKVGGFVPVQYLKRQDIDLSKLASGDGEGDLIEFTFEEQEIRVIGIHDSPFRAIAYMDIRHAHLMNLEGAANQVFVIPAEGVTIDEIERKLFGLEGVASVQAVKEISEMFDEFMEIFTTILRIIQGIVVFLAFLIAFNSTSISVDERTREISTMFAFGLRIRTVTRMQMLENFLIGVMGTLIGVAGGWWLLSAFLTARVEEQMEDFEFIVTISPETLFVSLLLGVLTVTLTPLLSIRRMMKMDLPSTLRVLE